MIIWISIQCTAILCGILYVIYLLREMHNAQRVQMSYLIEKVTATEKNCTTLAKVVTVYEEETKVLQKRNERLQAVDRVKDAFKSRNPR